MKENGKKLFLKITFFLFPLVVGLVTISITLLMLFDVPFPVYSVIGCSFVFGTSFWFLALHYKTLYRFYFISTFLIQLAGFLSVHEFGLLPYSYKALWPFFMIFISTSFTISGYARFRSFRPSQLALASPFMMLGVLFLLFSTELIQIPFITFALIAIPLFLIPGLLSFVYWLYKIQMPSGRLDE